MGKSTKHALSANLHRGMPDAKVELKDNSIWIKLDADENTTDLVKDTKVMITLERIEADIHDQSYGMIAASTGCYSNPGGPGC